MLRPLRLKPSGPGAFQAPGDSSLEVSCVHSTGEHLPVHQEVQQEKQPGSQGFGCGVLVCVHVSGDAECGRPLSCFFPRLVCVTRTSSYEMNDKVRVTVRQSARGESKELFSYLVSVFLSLSNFPPSTPRPPLPLNSPPPHTHTHTHTYTLLVPYK